MIHQFETRGCESDSLFTVGFGGKSALCNTKQEEETGFRIQKLPHEGVRGVSIFSLGKFIPRESYPVQLSSNPMKQYLLELVIVLIICTHTPSFICKNVNVYKYTIYISTYKSLFTDMTHKITAVMRQDESLLMLHSCYLYLAMIPYGNQAPCANELMSYNV